MTEGRPERALHTATRLAARIGGAMIFLIALLVCGDVLMRNLFNKIVFHSYELSNYLFAIAVAFSLAYTLVERAHIRIEVVHNLFPSPLRRALDTVALLSVVGTAALFAWTGWELALGNLARGSNSNSTLNLPIGVPQALWATGLTIFAVVAAVLTVRHVQMLLTGRPEQADAIGGMGSEIPADPETTNGNGRTMEVAR